MKSRIFLAIEQAVRDNSFNRGGRGHRNPTRPLRVPLYVCDFFDALIEDWDNRIAEASSSGELPPRYYYLKQFLDELHEMFPVEDQKS